MSAVQSPCYQDTNYTLYQPYVNIINNLYEGEILSKQYLEKYYAEDKQDFEKRIKYAYLKNHIKRTIDTTTDIIFRKSIDTQEITNVRLQEYLEKLDLRKDINEFAKDVLRARIKDGITYIMIDSPIFDKEEVTNNDVRPYAVHVKRSEIVNVQKDSAGNIQTLTRLETYYDKSNPYKWEQKEQYKFFRVNGNDCEVEVWRENKKQEELSKTLPFPVVPIVQIGEDISPPLLSMAYLNINQLNRDNEIDINIRQCLMMVLMTYGLERDSDLTLSVHQGLDFDNKQENGAEWLEAKGNNAQTGEERVKTLETAMLDIAVTFATTSNVKTATQVEKESTSDESKLVNYSKELEAGLNDMILMLGRFVEGSNYENQKISVNRDFNANMLTSEQIREYTSLYNNGIISWETFYNILAKGEVLEVLSSEDLATEKMRIRNENKI